MESVYCNWFAWAGSPCLPPKPEAVPVDFIVAVDCCGTIDAVATASTSTSFVDFESSTFVLFAAFAMSLLLLLLLLFHGSSLSSSSTAPAAPAPRVVACIACNCFLCPLTTCPLPAVRLAVLPCEPHLTSQRTEDVRWTFPRRKAMRYCGSATEPRPRIRIEDSGPTTGQRWSLQSQRPAVQQSFSRLCSS